MRGVFRIEGEPGRTVIRLLVLLVGGISNSGASIASEALGYDLKGNITSRQTANGTTSFQYDNLNRLTSEQGPQATQGYTYDANGNRLSDGAGSYSYVPNSNVIATEHGNTVVHDVAGNLIDDGRGLTFEYNQAGRLKRVFDNSVLVATYTYNALGQRTRKVTPAGTTLYHYDLDGQLVSETLADGAPQTSYVWRNRKPASVVYAPGTPSNSSGQERVVYLHADHLNTPRWATDDQKITVWKWESDVFGSSAADSDPDGDQELTKIILRFPGQYIDDESGLYYNYSRYYSPVSGRYTAVDPIGLSGGNNTYSYVNNSPAGLSDRYGLYYSPTLEVIAISEQGVCETNVSVQENSGAPFDPEEAGLFEQIDRIVSYSNLSVSIAEEFDNVSGEKVPLLGKLSAVIAFKSAGEAHVRGDHLLALAEAQKALTISVISLPAAAAAGAYCGPICAETVGVAVGEAYNRAINSSPYQGAVTVLGHGFASVFRTYENFFGD